MSETNETELHLAQAVRDACIAAAKEGYERAAMSGLCEEGAFEAALSAIHLLDLDAVLKTLRPRSR
jgi:hypothetical protein